MKNTTSTLFWSAEDGQWIADIPDLKSLPEGSGLLFVGDGFNTDPDQRGGDSLAPVSPENKLASVMAASDLQVVTLQPGMEGLDL